MTKSQKVQEQPQSLSSAEIYDALPDASGIRNLTHLDVVLSWLRDVDYEQQIRASGVSLDDYQLLVGNRVWATAQARSIGRDTFNKVISGSLVISGMAPVDFPAEYVAVQIVCLVNPANWSLLCRMLDAKPTTSQLINNAGEATFEREPANRMFARCWQLYEATDASQLDAHRKAVLSAITGRLRQSQKG